MTAKELGQTVDAFNDGLRVAEVTVGGNRMDLTLVGPDKHVNRTENISNLPVVTRSGLVLPAGSLAKVIVTSVSKLSKAVGDAGVGMASHSTVSSAGTPKIVGASTSINPAS